MPEENISKQKTTEFNSAENIAEKKTENLKEKELNAEFIELVEKSNLGIDDKIILLLTKGGLKPASVLELPLKLQTQEEAKEFFKENDIEEIIELVKKSGLEYHIGEKEKIKGSYRTKDEPETEKFSQAEQMNIFIANSKEKLDYLQNVWGTKDQETIGLALGFPKTAAEAFAGKKAVWNRDNMPVEIKESDAIAFLTPTLSKDNWQEEIKEGKNRAEFIKRNSPKIYEARMKSEENHRKWDKVKNEIENTADKEGHGIDEGIKDSVIALNVIGINTGQSCEGHTDSGKKSAPWIRIEALNEPPERFIGQNEAFEKVAKKYNMPLQEAKRMFNENAYWEAMHECQENGEKEEYKKWQEKSVKLLYMVKEILNDFYKNRQVPENVRIKTDTEGLDDMSEGSFEIFNGGKDYRIINGIKLPEKKKESLEGRLEQYRKEMRDFADFLEEKFFSEGEMYINNKRNRAQEKIDKEKIKEVQNKLKIPSGENKNEQTQSENKEASGKKEPAEKAAREEELKQAINKIVI